MCPLEQLISFGPYHGTRFSSRDKAALFPGSIFFFAHMQRKKVTQKENAHNRGPSCGRSDLEVRTQTAASLFTLFSCVFHSPPPPPPSSLRPRPFHTTTLSSSEPRKIKSRIYKRNTANQWFCCMMLNSTPFDWGPRGQGTHPPQPPRARWVIRCLCARMCFTALGFMHDAL